MRHGRCNLHIKNSILTKHEVKMANSWRGDKISLVNKGIII